VAVTPPRGSISISHPRTVVDEHWWNGWFSALTTRKLQPSAHRSEQPLTADIRTWVDAWNENPNPVRVAQISRRDPRTPRRLLRRLNKGAEPEILTYATLQANRTLILIA